MEPAERKQNSLSSENERNDSRDVDISLGDILDYVGDSIRPLREGQTVFQSGHVVCIGYTKSAAHLEISGFVLQSSHPGDVPHEVDLQIWPDYRQWVLRCSCKAGTARCKHIIACLLHLEKAGAVEYLTCTSSRQAWGISKAEKTHLWKAKRIMDLCCVRKPSTPVEVDISKKAELLRESFRRILEVSPTSAIQKHITGRELSCPRPASGPLQNIDMNIYITEYELRDLLVDCDHLAGWDSNASSSSRDDLDNFKAFYEKKVVKTVAEIIKICEQTKCQDNNAWRLHRSIRVTGSSCYELFTYSKNKNPDWTKKIQSYLNPKPLHTKAVQYGKDMEQAAFSCNKEKRNPLIKKCGFVVSPENSWMGVSPDGIDPLNKVLLEIKCPLKGAEHSIEWLINECQATKCYIKQVNSVLEINRKHKYYAQVQLGMHILNIQKCDFIIFSKYEGNFAVVEIDYDKTFPLI
nr:uncharacterized protein LOC115257492 [Aedes albopictus]